MTRKRPFRAPRKILGFGAVLWDDIVDPAAPSIGSVAGEANIGGAVFNVVVHLQRLGYAAYMLSAIGRDPLGERTRRELDRLGIRPDFIGSVAAPTCLIEVTFDSAGQPHYSSPDLVSWDQIEAPANLVAEVDALAFDVLVFGTLEQRSSTSRATLRRVLEGARVGQVFLDLTLRGNYFDRDLLDYSMRRADIIKMNDDEARVVNELFGFGRKKLRELLPVIAGEFDSDLVCITLGADGTLAGGRSEVLHAPGYRVPVVDTVGCGDAFSAGLLYRLGAGASLADACDFGNRMGALISAKRSSIPEYDLAELDRLRQ